MKSSRRAVIYVRISLDRAGEGLGIQRQEEECRALCERNGWEIVEVASDNDFSASSGKHRPGYARALSMIENGEADAFCAWAWDRVTRQPRELEDFVSVIEKARADVGLVQAGQVDLTTPAGRAFARMLGAINRMEVEQKSARQQSAERQRATSGRRRKGGGSRPFGWNEDRATLHPYEAPALRDAIHDVTYGKSLRSLIADWNADADLTPARGGQWRYSTVRGVLLRPANAGLSVYQGEVLPGVVGDWEPIVSVDEHEAVCAVLSDPSRRTTTSNRKKHYLVGIARCGVCDAPMNRASVRIRGVYRPVFRCRTMSNHAIRSAEPIEEAVTESILERLSRDDVAELFTPRPKRVPRKMTTDIEALRSRKARLEADYLADLISGQQLKLMSEELDSKIRDAQAALATTTLPGVPERVRRIKPGTVGKVWESLSVGDKGAVVDALMTVTIYPTSDSTYGDWPYGCRLEWK